MMGVSVSGAIQVPMGWVADRVNRKAMVVVGGLVVTASVYSFVHATGFHYLFWASIVFGLGGGISMPALWLNDENEHRAEEAKGLIEQYQEERAVRIRREYEELKQQGKHRRLSDAFRRGGVSGRRCRRSRSRIGRRHRGRDRSAPSRADG